MLAEEKNGRSRFSDWTLKMRTESSMGVLRLPVGYFREGISVYGKPLLKCSLYIGHPSLQDRQHILRNC